MPTRVKVIIAALFAVGVGIFVSLAFVGGGSGKCTPPKPDAVKTLFPGCNVSVLGQTQIGVEMQDGYHAELTLNDVPIPQDQVTSGGQSSNSNQIPSSPNAGNGAAAASGTAQTRFLFTPPPLSSGSNSDQLALRPFNRLTVRYWPIAEGEEAAKSYSWQFNAT
jgi:hypothetical protein